jgi:orotidine-5'-phosphate decarboxylase
MNAILKKYELRADAIQSLLCVGLDPILSQIPEPLRSARDPLFAFNKRMIDLTAQYTAAYKPNSAFYEAHGSRGI